jgi:hypothetical protein
MLDEYTIRGMTYLLKIDEDYESEHGFFEKLDNWLQNEIGFLVRETQGAHYGYVFIDQHYRDIWNEMRDQYVYRYQAQFESHFGFKMPISRVAEIERVVCDDWSILRVLFCYDDNIANVRTNGKFFYAVDVTGDETDSNMIRFKLIEM